MKRNRAEETRCSVTSEAGYGTKSRNVTLRGIYKVKESRKERGQRKKTREQTDADG